MKYEELYPNCHPNLRGQDVAAEADDHTHTHPAIPCPRLPGTLLRIFIPAGAVINILNLIELSSPSGVCIIVRVPFLGGLLTGDGGNGENDTNRQLSLTDIVNAVRKVGGTVEVINK